VCAFTLGRCIRLCALVLSDVLLCSSASVIVAAM
jgi:hypothetical protein